MNPQMTTNLARAAATDAANKQMRAAGRTTWCEDDYDLACDKLAALMKLVATHPSAPVCE